MKNYWRAKTLLLGATTVLLFIVFFFALPFNAHAETNNERWDQISWLNAGLVIGTTIILYNNDQAIQRFFVENRKTTTDSISGIVKPFGDPVYLIPTLLIIYIASKRNPNDNIRQVAELGLESIILTDTATGLLKLATHRHRPYTGSDFNHWDGPNLNLSNDRLSFPSLHAANAFALATVVSSVYHDNKFVAPIAYSLASLTALSRIHDNDHWASDVFFGAVLGYYTAKIIIGRHLHPAVEPKYTIIPRISGQTQELLLSVRF